MTDLDFSDSAIKQSLDTIRSASTPDIFVVLGHVGVTNKIKVVETGKTFGDLKDELDASKLQYAYVRFDINGQNKFAFISMVGDGISNIQLKGKSAGYVRSMETFMKGYYHLHVSARNEDDVDEASIRKKLVTATGAFYTQMSNQKSLNVEQAKEQVTNKPDLPVRKQASPMVDKAASEQYWKKEQEEQAKAKQAEKQQTAGKDPKAIAEERAKFWAKEQQETSSNSRAAAAPSSTAAASDPKKLAEERAKFWAQQEQEQQQQQQQTQSRTANQVSGNASGMKARFEQLAQAQKEDKPAPVQKPASTGAKWAPKPAPAPVSVSEPAPAPAPVYTSSPAPAPAPVAPEKPSFKPAPVVVVSYDEPEPEPEPEPAPQPQYDEYYEEEPAAQAEPEPAPQEEQYYQEETPAYEPEPEPAQPVYEEQPQYQQEEPAAQEEAGSGMPADAKRVAVAQYDFASEDPEELPFSEGEQVYVIADEGDWWTCENMVGRRGFVPGNYLA